VVAERPVRGNGEMDCAGVLHFVQDDPQIKN